jgi:hypothetical protein
LSESEENDTRSVLRRLRNPAKIDDSNSEVSIVKISKLVDSTSKQLSHSTNTNLAESLVESTKAVNNNLVDSTSPPELKAGVHQKSTVDSRKNDRHNKNKTRIQPRIDKVILKKIKGFCVKNGMELGEYIEMLALHHLELVESTKRETRSPQIDKTIHYRSSSLIINLYETMMKKNRWTWNDDKEAARFSDDQIDAIECAMIRTIIRAKQPIRTFKYFIPEIEIELAMNVSPELRLMQLAQARKVLEMHRQGIEIDAFG